MRLKLRGSAYLLGFSLFFPVCGMSASMAESTYQTWLNRAWNYDPELLEARARLQNVEAALLKARSGFYPSLSAKYQLRENERLPRTRIFSLNAEQNFFRGFQDLYKSKEASTLFDAEYAAYEAKKQGIAKEVAETLLAIAGARAQKLIYEENGRILDRRLAEYKRRIRIGKSRDVDLLQNQIDRLRLERKLASNAREETAAFAALYRRTGETGNQEKYDLGQLLSEVKNYNEQLDAKSLKAREQELRWKAQAYAVTAAGSTYWPSVKGVASYYPSNDSSFSRNSDDWSVGLELEWKLFEGFSGYGALKEEKADSRLRESTFQNTRAVDDEFLSRVRAEWKQLREELTLVVEAESLAVRELKAQERDFKLGLVTVLELDRSDEQYLSLKLEKIALQKRLGELLAQAIDRGGIEGLNL